MTPQEQLAIIKQKVIEAVPSILDLKFGCEVQYKWDNKPKYIVVGTFEVSEKNTPTQVECREIDGRKYDTVLSVDTLEIIGRPIQLSDVLLAIKENSYHEIYTASWWVNVNTLIFKWNLLLPLDGQSEEVWAFLAELLHD